jgi:excisionase family DNA binding protein
MQLNQLERAAFGIGEIARAMGTSNDTVRRLIAAGKLRAVRFSRRVLIPASELRRILDVESPPVQTATPEAGVQSPAKVGTAGRKPQKSRRSGGRHER